MTKTTLAIVLLGFALWCWMNVRSPISRTPGVVAPDPPVQVNIRSENVARYRNLTLESVAHFAVEARVLGVEWYRFDELACLCPVDLALGWGRMSDEAILEKIEISQTSRFYLWHATSFPIPPEEIMRSSCNMHIIPTNSKVRDALRGVRLGHIVNFSGELVNVKRDDGTMWRTSINRNDSGAGACEIVWVKDLQVW